MNRDRDNKNREQPLDELLDGALARYSDAEPRAGLEDRILANLRMQPDRARSSWWSWNWNSMTVGGAAVAAVVLVAILLLPWQRRESQVGPSIAASNTNSAGNSGAKGASKIVKEPSRATTMAAVARPTNPTAGGASAAGKLTKRAVGANTAFNHRQEVAAVPHQAVFPSPTPPSEQERMLLSYVHTTPKEVLVAVSEEQQQHEQEWLEQMKQLQKSAQKSGSL